LERQTGSARNAIGGFLMKLDLPVIPPAGLKEGWPGQYQVFSWYNFALNIPTAVFMVTTLKKNGLSNVQLNAWGMLIGSGKEPKFILQVMHNSDTCRLIRQNQEFVINFPSYDRTEYWLKTAEHYPEDIDEISTSGLTPEPSSVVAAPRIKECYAHYECTLDWMREVEEEVPINTLIQGRIVNATIDEEYLGENAFSTYQKRAIPYHISEFYDHHSKECRGMGGFCRLNLQNAEFIKE
jgi:flavin reductase (DIM6/NTAB) family NADH-FMN oxidoreductase RutF